MRAFGGTCPMCCGDLDDVLYLEMGAAVCVYCGHTHVETAAGPAGSKAAMRSDVSNLFTSAAHVPPSAPDASLVSVTAA